MKYLAQQLTAQFSTLPKENSAYGYVVKQIERRVDERVYINICINKMLEPMHNCYSQNRDREQMPVFWI